MLNWEEHLKSWGIQISYLIAGCAGALVFLNKTAGKNLGLTFITLSCGAICANYLVPVIVKISHLDNIQIEYSLAFLTGYCGKTALELIIDKIQTRFEIPLLNSKNESKHHNKKH